MRSLDEFATAKLAELERDSLRRELVETVRVTGIWMLRNGRRLLSFCCNDYLNLTHHPAVVEAATQALRLYGTGAGASRLVTGNHPLYAELEHRLAQLKEAPHLTLHKLKDMLAAHGIAVSHDTVWRFLRRQGRSFKKNRIRQ